MNVSDGRLNLERGRLILQELFAGVPSTRANWKPAPDRWSATEIAAHLADIELEDFREDVDIILNRTKDAWPSFDELGWVEERKYNDRNLLSEIRRFMDARDSSLAWLDSLGNPDPETEFQGAGNPRCFGGRPARLGDILSSWIGHDLFHIRQLALLQWDILNLGDDAYSPAYSGFEK